MCNLECYKETTFFSPVKGNDLEKDALLV